MSLVQDEISAVRGGLMSEMTSYAQPLRAIGQALETLNLKSFELEPSEEGFHVRGILVNAHPELSGDRVTAEKLNAIWGTLPDGQERVSTGTSPVLSPIELQYTPSDVDRLEEQGRAKRADPHRTPDAASLSQILRSVGAYLTQKPARLLRLSRDEDSLSIEYRTTLGSVIKETLAVGELYDLWVRMYLQRAERVSQ